MRRIRTAIALAGIGAALAVGLATPAQGAITTARPAAATADPMLFGVYYTLEYCQYFGNSLVSGGQFSSYNCVYDYYPSDGQYHWYLYVWFR
jgi:hypothetical protein